MAEISPILVGLILIITVGSLVSGEKCGSQRRCWCSREVVTCRGDVSLFPKHNQIPGFRRIETLDLRGTLIKKMPAATLLEKYSSLQTIDIRDCYLLDCNKLNMSTTTITVISDCSPETELTTYTNSSEMNSTKSTDMTETTTTTTPSTTSTSSTTTTRTTLRSTTTRFDRIILFYIIRVLNYSY